MGKASIQTLLIDFDDQTNIVFIDTEELALILNGKKYKIKPSDFELAMSGSALEDKIIEKMLAKSEKTSEK